MQGNKAYQEPVEEVLRRHQVNPDNGLSQKEAAHRLQMYGENQLEEEAGTHPVMLFIHQFQDFMVLVLLAATLISGLLGEYSDAITIIAIVIINAILGFIQEYRAEHSLQALKQMTAPESRVLREGVLQEIPAREVVPGDLLYLESGDKVSADVRLINAENLKIEESALTGESLAVSKFTGPLPSNDLTLADQQNMAFMGTSVTQGRGIGVVVATGMQSEMGKIAHLIQSEEAESTPLERRLEHLGKVLVAGCLVLTALVVVLGVIQGNDLYKMFLAGVSLAVAAIPEGLPAIVTVALALGVQRMIKRNALVRKLPAVETLGTATVICSDKTGTLTQNKMTVTRIFTGGREIEVEGSGYRPEGRFLQEGKPLPHEKKGELMRILEIAVLCNNASLVQRGEKDSRRLRKKVPLVFDWDIQGDPTEGALWVAAAKAGLTQEKVHERWRRIKEYPFDATRKMMSVVAEASDGSRWVMVKGAPEVLLDRCNQILFGGQAQPFTLAHKQQVADINEAMAAQALRNLGFACRRLGTKEMPAQESEAERDLVFIGLMGMMDPPREGVKEAISKCRKAGIRTVMITGDHQRTAEAIAKDLGMIQEGGRVLSGSELNQLGQSKLMQQIDEVYVYARVSPEHKLRIVKALQAKGEIVAMTGDGVNDAPAVKAADIGITMGMTGTDVTKEASALTLADDNFATIVAAIEEGRGIYENIRKFIRYMLASNVGEILTMLFAMLMAMPLPLLPIQILWVNLVTDGLPAMALGIDGSEDEVMKRPPRDARESVFSRGLGWKILSRGTLIGLVSVGVFWLTLVGRPEDLVKAQTMAFATLVMAQLIHVFDCRSEQSIFARNPLGNRFLVLAVSISVLMLMAVIYIDFLQPIFHTTPLLWADWLIVLLAAAIPSFAVAAIQLMGRKQW